MAMVGIDSGRMYRRTHSLGRLVLGRRPLGAVLYSSNEPGELSQWLCYDDSTINIFFELLLLLLLYYYYYYYYLFTSDKGGGKCVCPRSFVCLFVCLSVSKITQKRVHGFG